MTAVPIQRLVVMRQEGSGIWVEGFFTVGVSNAVKAGEPTDSEITKPELLAPGTINIVLVTNARLARPAMVGAVQVATESKTAALLAARVRSWTGRRWATGTGTDAVVVVSGEGQPHRFSGTHTKIGELIGQLVLRGVLNGLLLAKNG
jgi:adenosylcobinamide amidohydrolase